MGTTRADEVRVQVFALMALVVLAGVLVVSGAVAFGGKWRMQMPGSAATQNVGGASATYDQR